MVDLSRWLQKVNREVACGNLHSPLPPNQSWAPEQRITQKQVWEFITRSTDGSDLAESSSKLRVLLGDHCSKYDLTHVSEGIICRVTLKQKARHLQKLDSLLKAIGFRPSRIMDDTHVKHPDPKLRIVMKQFNKFSDTAYNLESVKKSQEETLMQQTGVCIVLRLRLCVCVCV
jgi:hypothetical protein